MKAEDGKMRLTDVADTERLFYAERQHPLFLHVGKDTVHELTSSQTGNSNVSIIGVVDGNS